MNEAMLSIDVKPPFSLELTVWVLRRRAKNIVDQWDGRAYQRVLIRDNLPVLITAVQSGSKAKPVLGVKLKCQKTLSKADLVEIRGLIKKMFGLSVDLKPFYTLVGKDNALEALAQQFEGVKPTRYPTIFEALVNAIACQQVSLDAGIAILNRLTEAFGTKFRDGKTVIRAFPRPEDLLDVSESDMRQLGFSRQKSRAISGLAYGILSKSIDLENHTNEQAATYLQSIHGIGRWSAEYALLRGLGRLDVFPGDDIGGQNNLQRLLHLETRPDYEKLESLVASWHPYAGFVYFHLLLEKLHYKGVV